MKTDRYSLIEQSVETANCNKTLIDKCIVHGFLDRYSLIEQSLYIIEPSLIS